MDVMDGQSPTGLEGHQSDDDQKVRQAAQLLSSGNPAAAIECLNGKTLNLDGHLLMAEALWTQAGPGGTRESLKHYEAAELAAGADVSNVSKQAAVALGHGWALLQLKDPNAHGKLAFARDLAQKDGNSAAIDFVDSLLENAEQVEQADSSTEEATWAAFVKAYVTSDQPVVFMCGSIHEPLDEASASGVARLKEAGVKAVKSVNVSETGPELPGGLQTLSSLSVKLPQLYLKGALVENWMKLDTKDLRSLLADAGANLRSEESEPCHGVFSDGLENWQIRLIDLISKRGLGDWDSKAKELQPDFPESPKTGSELEEAWNHLAPLVKDKLEEQQEMPCGHSCNTCPTKHDCQLHDAVGSVRDIERRLGLTCHKRSVAIKQMQRAKRRMAALASNL